MRGANWAKALAADVMPAIALSNRDAPLDIFDLRNQVLFGTWYLILGTWVGHRQGREMVEPGYQ